MYVITGAGVAPTNSQMLAPTNTYLIRQRQTHLRWNRFHKTARDTKRAMCKQNAKMNLLLGGCPSWFYVLCQSHTCMPRASNTNGCALFIGLGECGWSMGPETTEYTQMHM